MWEEAAKGFKFKVGDVVRHRTTGLGHDEMMVITQHLVRGETGLPERAYAVRSAQGLHRDRTIIEILSEFELEPVPGRPVA